VSRLVHDERDGREDRSGLVSSEDAANRPKSPTGRPHLPPDSNCLVGCQDCCHRLLRCAASRRRQLARSRDQQRGALARGLAAGNRLAPLAPPTEHAFPCLGDGPWQSEVVPCADQRVAIDPMDNVFGGTFPENFSVDAGPLGRIREVATRPAGDQSRVTGKLTAEASGGMADCHGSAGVTMGRCRNDPCVTVARALPVARVFRVWVERQNTVGSRPEWRCGWSLI
jgi:hypothetical protein